MKNSSPFYCDGVPRRDFLRIGAISGFGMGMTLQHFLSQTAQAASPSVAGSPLQQGSGTKLPGKAKAAASGGAAESPRWERLRQLLSK
jgi:hypothetical protein